MTSGQNGPYGEPGEQGQPGPPQGWNPPPPPQGWNPPPPQQPYGQQYPGYAPAPSAPTGHGAPPAVERPPTVRAGIGAFLASLILSLVALVVTFADMDTLIAEALATSTDPAVTEDVVRAGLVIAAIIGLVIFALQALFLWFAWQGRNWARIVLMVLGGLAVLFGLAGSAMGTAQTGFLDALGWFQLLLTAAGVVLLAMKPSSDWYRYRSWQRANRLG